MLNLSNREILLVKWSIKEWRKKRRIAGFFFSTPERERSGCSYEMNEGGRLDAVRVTAEWRNGMKR
jgi:hypothetical protein